MDKKLKKPILKLRGAGRIGKSMIMSWNITYPFSKLEFYDDRILFHVWPKKVILRFKEIDSVELFKEIFFWLEEQV